MVRGWWSAITAILSRSSQPSCCCGQGLVVSFWWSAIVLSFAVVRGWWSAIILSCWWSILHEFFRRTLSRSFREKWLFTRFPGFLSCFSRTTGNSLEYDELGLAGLLACRGLCALIPLARCHLRTILMTFSCFWNCMFFLNFSFGFRLKNNFFTRFPGFSDFIFFK